MSIVIEMSKTQHKSVIVEDIAEVKDFVHKGWVVDEVGNVEVVAMCEVCELPILDFEEFYSDEEGVCWHVMCEGSDK